MATYDRPGNEPDRGGNTITRADDDELRRISGIGPEEEKSLENSAYSGAAEDMAEREQLDDKTGKDGKKSDSKDSQNDSQPEIPFNDEGGKGQKKNLRGRLLNKKTAIGGGITGLVISGIIGIMSFTSGPLGLIHFSQLLQRFHFSNSTNLSDMRLSHLINYGRGKAYRNNLGVIGNKITDKIDTRLRAGGIELEYNRLGKIQATHIDIDTDQGKRMIRQLESRGMDIDLDSAITHITEDGVTRRRISIDLSSAADFRQVRNVSGAAVNSINKSGVSGAVSKRLLTIRSGSTSPLMHPIEYAVRRSGESLQNFYARFNGERNEKIRTGASAPETLATEDAPTATDSNGEPVHNPDAAARAAQQADDIEDILGDAGIDGSSTASIRSGLTKKFAVGGAVGVGAISLFCGLHQLGDSIAVIQHANVVLPLIRLGTEMVAVGSQIQSGQDISMDAIGAVASNLYSDGEVLETVNDMGMPTTVTTQPSSAYSAASIQENLGQEPTGAALPNSAKAGKERPAFFQLINSVVSNLPGGSTACRFVNSTIGGWIVDAADVGITIFTGGLTKAVASGVGAAAGNLLVPSLLGGFIEDMTRTLAGTAVDITDISGGQFGALADAGAFLANNDSMMAMGGTELTAQQSAALRQESNQLYKEQFAQKSLATRLFDPYESQSLLSVTLLQNASFASAGNVFQSLASFIPNLTGMFAGSFSRLASATAGAAPLADPVRYYGVPEYGFSIEDRDNPLVDNPYENADYITDHPEVVEEYQECFGSTVSADGRLSPGQAKRYDEIPDKCNSDSTDLLRYRFYLLDTITAKSMACYESIDESACGELGLGGANASTPAGPTGPVANPGEDTSAQNCPADPLITDGGIAEKYGPGRVLSHRIRLCIIDGDQGLDVNVSIARNVADMVRAARAAGVELTPVSSGYRTFDHQADLRVSNGCPDIYFSSSSSCSTPTARPGESNHEEGLAIDFSGISKCPSRSGDRCVAPGNAKWDWLEANARQYGLNPLRSEAWHWSVTGR